MRSPGKKSTRLNVVASLSHDRTQKFTKLKAQASSVVSRAEAESLLTLKIHPEPFKGCFGSSLYGAVCKERQSFDIRSCLQSITRNLCRFDPWVLFSFQGFDHECFKTRSMCQPSAFWWRITYNIIQNQCSCEEVRYALSEPDDSYFGWSRNT